MKIGVDIDEPMYPCARRMHELSVEAGITNGKTWTCWTPWVDYGCSSETWLEVMSEGILNGDLYDEPPLPGTQKQLQRLLDAGHTVHLVTARASFIHGEIIMRDTTEWLPVWGIPYTTLTFSKDKTVVPTDWFIDDNLENFEALVAAGTRAVLLNAPHNQPGLTSSGQTRYCHRRRVDTLEQFVDLVLRG